MSQLAELVNQEYRPEPNPDCERLIVQVMAAGVPRFIAEPAIIKHERELSSKIAYG
jgi:hypothetical protein